MQAEVNQGLQEGLQVLKQQKNLAEALAEGRGQEVQGLKQEVKDLTGRLTEAESRVHQGELIRRKLHNTILVGFPSDWAESLHHLISKQDTWSAKTGTMVTRTRRVCTLRKYVAGPYDGSVHGPAVRFLPARLDNFDVVKQQVYFLQELKGNIRVFCRVRPLLGSDALTQTTAADHLIQFPSSGVPLHLPQLVSLSQHLWLTDWCCH